MARTVTLLGVSYSIPESGDSGYDQTQLSNFLVALGTAFPQINGGLYTLTAELDFGTSFGLKALYQKSETANPASAGQLRLAKTDSVKWRNNANAADLALGIDTGDALTFGGGNVTGNPMLAATTAAAQSITTAVTTIVVFGTVERDSDSAYNAGTGRYTIPANKGGDYTIQSGITWTGAAAGIATIAIFKNAVQIRATQFASPAAGQGMGVATIANVAPGDIIDIRVTQNSGGAVTLLGSATANWFSLKRIPT